MTNKGFEAKAHDVRPLIARKWKLEIEIKPKIKEYPSRLKRKKAYDGKVLKKQKSFTKLPF